MLRVTDRLLSPFRGSADDALLYAAKFYAPNGDAFIRDYVIELYRVCASLGLDASLLIAQSVHETFNPQTEKPWDSHWFRTRGNPAGLGITGDPDENERSATFPTGKSAAWAHAAHVAVYAYGPADAGSLWFRRVDNGLPIARVDPRYGAYLDAYGNTAQARTLNDLTGKWAVDSRYAEKIVEKGRLIFPALPDQGATPPMPLNMTPGLIPLPPMALSLVDVSKRCQGDGRGFDDLGFRTVRGVVLHRSQGTWEGNQSHFHSHCPGALTDIQVHHVDGRMMRFVRMPGDSPSGWANGRVSGAYGDGKAFVDRYGINAVNRDLESCEITGFFAQPGQTTREDPVSDACWESLAQWIASRAHDYGITYETFPLIPAEGNRSFVIWHQEFTIGTGKVCPGKTVMDGTTAMIDRARAIMMEAQIGADPIPEPGPSPFPTDPVPAPDELRAQGHTLMPLTTRRRKAIQGGRFRTAPSRDAPEIKKPYYFAGKSYVFDFSAMIDGEEWYVSKRGSWAPAANFTEAA